MANKDFIRKVTHKDYKNPDKLKRYYHRVEKQVHVKPSKFHKGYVNSKHSDYIACNDKFLVTKVPWFVVPLLFGGVSLLFLLGVIRYSLKDGFTNEHIFFLVLASFLTLFFLIYGFTIPKKEHILNRKDGLITMTGFLWQKNITMEFKKVEFAYSTGGDNVIGAFELEAIRPNKWQTFDMFSIVGAECYEQMSFITWYMDKNRPLPPSTALDKYRQQDFERRKAEGFPKPLYPSNIPTPEATPEQQAERRRIGGW